METTERAAVRRTLDRLKPYLAAWIKDQTDQANVANPFANKKLADLQEMLKLVIAEWDAIFGKSLRPHARTYFFEAKDLRNRWAHEDEFTPDDVTRASDTINQILKAIGAPRLESRSVSMKAPLKQSRKPNQRDTMRAIFKRVGNNEDRLVAEYAAAEKRGDVIRKRNIHGMTAEDYARALLKDAANKGWLDH